MDESIGLRGIKGMVGGILLAAVILMPCLFFLQPYVTAYHVVAGIMTSAILGLVLKACIPKGFPIPKDITTISSLGVSAFCLWVVIDGIITGAIHDVPRRRGEDRMGFSQLWSWQSNRGDFVFAALCWALFAGICIGWPLWFYLKAIRETSPSLPSLNAPLDSPSTVRSILIEWRKLSKTYQAFFVFTIAISSILVLFYLVILINS